MWKYAQIPKFPAAYTYQEGVSLRNKYKREYLHIISISTAFTVKYKINIEAENLFQLLYKQEFYSFVHFLRIELKANIPVRIKAFLFINWNVLCT